MSAYTHIDSATQRMAGAVQPGSNQTNDIVISADIATAAQDDSVSARDEEDCDADRVSYGARLAECALDAVCRH